MPYTGTQGQSPFGLTFAINTATGTTPTWTTIGEITAAPQSGRMNKTADATNLESTAVEWIPTIPDGGSWDVSCNRVSGDAGQIAVDASYVARTLKQYKVTLPLTAAQTTTGDSYLFNALVEESNPLSEISPDKIIVDKFKLKVSNGVTMTAGT